MKKRSMTKLILAACSVFLAAGMLCTLALAEDDEINIWIEPYMISLNANDERKADNEIVVTLGCNLNGMRITDEDIKFIISDDDVAEAVSARVTRTGLVQVYFDRAEIQDYAIDNNLAEEVVVTVSGFCIYEPISGGDDGTITFTGDGAVFFR
jgi:hypothetical protein